MASDDDFSDHTDMESDDYADTTKKKKLTAKSGGKPAYKIKNALKVPRATTYTAQALYGMKFPQLFVWHGLIWFYYRSNSFL